MVDMIRDLVTLQRERHDDEQQRREQMHIERMEMMWGFMAAFGQKQQDPKEH